MERNGVISFWKFAFALLIVFFHGNILGSSSDTIIGLGGYIGVEFFFVVSGVFLASSIVKKFDQNTSNLGKDTVLFIAKKIKTFFPYLLLAYILLISLYIFKYDVSFSNLLSSIWELLLLNESGIRHFSINTPVWYLSSMILSMFIIYPLMRKFKMNYVYIVAPLVVYLGIGYLNHLFVGLNHTVSWTGFTLHNNIRAFSELNLGIIIYFLIDKIKNIKFTSLGIFILTFIEMFCLSCPFIISTIINNSPRYDFIMLFIMAIGILIAMGNITLEKRFLNNKFIYFLEKLSLVIFIFHGFCLKITVLYTKNIGLNYYEKLIIYLGLTLLVSIIIYILVEFLKKRGFFIEKIKRLFVILD